MTKCYTLENKPEFVNGQEVDVDMLKLTGSLNGTKRGKVIGKSSTHVVDMWVIDFGEVFSEVYLYQAVAVPHVCIVAE